MEVDFEKVLQKETIKVTKNLKGFTWEIKFFVENSTPERDKRIEDTIRDLRLADNALRARFELGEEDA